MKSLREKIKNFLKNLKNSAKYKDDILYKFKDFITICISIIIIGNICYFFKEILMETVGFIEILITRVLPIILFMIFYFLFRNNLKIYKYASSIITYICGTLILLVSIFSKKFIGYPSGEGEILYYIMAGLTIAPCFFSFIGQAIGLFSCITFSVLLEILGNSPKYLYDNLPARIIICGICVYFLGLTFSYYMYSAYLSDYKHEMKLKKALNTDPLCQIYNRFWINNFGMLDNCIFCILDCDKFKQINDTYGHDVGDIVLASNSKIISKMLIKDKEHIARFGGDEFILILDRNRNVEEFRKNVDLELEKFYSNKKYKSTVSIGFTVIDKPTSIEEAMKIADKYLYKLKALKS